MSSYRYRSNTNSNSNSRSGGGNRYRGSVSRSPKRRLGQYIDPARFVKAANPAEVVEYIPTHKFQDFEVDDLIKTNLATKGYEIPTPIQDQTIPIALMGKDLIGIANTGTGKTAAFAVPILNSLISKAGDKALIIAPTRELAQQIEEQFKFLGRGSGLFGAVLIGGSPMGPQLRDLRGDPEIVIGTPGRIKDHIERGTLKLSKFNHVVLDEVDRMLDMGFLPDVRLILSELSNDRQSYFFSATIDAKVSSLIESFANEPVMVSIKTGDTNENVDQDVIHFTSREEKINKLHDILIKNDVDKIIVFDDTQRSVEKLSKELISRGFLADAIHGGKTQGQRQRALRRFKASEIKILVATDVAARGIDVIDITHVINYTTPQSYDDYIHRIGRAGRAGRTGQALTFVAQ